MNGQLFKIIQCTEKAPGVWWPIASTGFCTVAIASPKPWEVGALVRLALNGTKPYLEAASGQWPVRSDALSAPVTQRPGPATARERI